MKIKSFLLKWQGLIWASMFSVALLELRMLQTGSTNYSFLLWNLFLGYIPLGLSYYLISQRKVPKWKLISVALMWMLFFPNAPYIVTDLMHLGNYDKIPWLDGLMLFSFALTSLVAGLVSFLQMKHVMKQHLHSTLYRCFTLGVMLLSGFGVYLGRFERWNSWDLLAHPASLLYNSAYNLQNPKAIAVTLTFAGCMFTVLQLCKQVSKTIYDTDKKMLQ